MAKPGHAWSNRSEVMRLTGMSNAPGGKSSKSSAHSPVVNVGPFAQHYRKERQLAIGKAVSLKTFEKEASQSSPSGWHSPKVTHHNSLPGAASPGGGSPRSPLSPKSNTSTLRKVGQARRSTKDSNAEDYDTVSSQDENELPDDSASLVTGSGDRFSEVLKTLDREHRESIRSLQVENQELKKKLNSVINATWNFGKEGWTGKEADAEKIDAPGSLILRRQGDDEEHVRKEHSMVWTVSNDFREDTRDAQVTKTMSRNAFKVRETWKEEAQAGRGFRPRSAGGGGTSATSDAPVGRSGSKGSKISEDDRGTFVVEGSWFTKNVMMHPTSRRRLTWDIAAMVLLAYDMLTVPMQSFGIKGSWKTLMDWITLMFWTGDIFASLVTGYITIDGNVIMNPKKVVRTYLRSRWFGLDLLIVVPDWISTIGELVQERQQGGESGTELLRGFRVIRIFRLLRVGKAKRLLTILQDRIESESVFAIVRFFQFMAVLLYCGHVIAAAWYSVGVLGWERGLDGEENWIQVYDVDHRSVGYQYMTSLNWALANFSPGASANVYATNSGERACAVLSGFFGAIVVCLLTGWVASVFLNLQKNNEESTKQFWLLRHYMAQNNVPKALKTRILRFLNHQVNSKKDTVDESRLSVLGMLSDSLSAELSYSVSYGDLTKHSLFCILEECALKGTLKSLIESAFSTKALAADDVLMDWGVTSKNMYYLRNGQMMYVRQSGDKEYLKKDDWVCEASLWVMWAARGDCTARQNTDVVVVNAPAFGEVISLDPLMCNLMSAYCTQFVAWLNNMEQDDLTDVFFGGRSAGLVDGFVTKAKQRSGW